MVIETRRRWSDEERQRAVEETRSLPVSAVARKHGIAKSLLFRWRKDAGLTGKRKTFVAVRIAATPAAALASRGPRSEAIEAGNIEIELADGIKLKVNGTVRAETLRQVIAALSSRDPLGSSAS